MHRYAAGLVLTFLLVHSSAAAQERGKVGVTMGFPASVGLLWHAAENVAVRPEVSFAWHSSELGLSETDSQSFTTGISAIFYMKRWDDLAVYVSPRYSFGRSTLDARGFIGERESSTSTHFFSGSFGAQYWLGQRFSAFGELGLAYQRGSSETDLELPIDTDNSSTSFGTRSSVGIVFYF